jgi:DNA-binding PadR family transcriptional regulator
MSQWLQSGRRRDICTLLYDAGTVRGQQLKADLEATYDTRIDPSAFYGSLDALVDRGLVARRTDGIHDVYRLTEAGIDGVESHKAWLSDRLAGGPPETPSDETAPNDAPSSDTPP